MAGLKTRRSDESVDAFIAAIDDPRKRQDAEELRRMMTAATGEPGAMWGTSIVGFGTITYRSAAGRENEWFKVGFSPRKQALTLYLMDGLAGYQPLLRRLGAHSTGKACLYVKRLVDVDRAVLGELIERSVRHVEASAG